MTLALLYFFLHFPTLFAFVELACVFLPWLHFPFLFAFPLPYLHFLVYNFQTGLQSLSFRVLFAFSQFVCISSFVICEIAYIYPTHALPSPFPTSLQLSVPRPPNDPLERPGVPSHTLPPPAALRIAVQLRLYSAMADPFFGSVSRKSLNEGRNCFFQKKHPPCFLIFKNVN